MISNHMFAEKKVKKVNNLPIINDQTFSEPSNLSNP
jgi:hypothetical protein